MNEKNAEQEAVTGRESSDLDVLVMLQQVPKESIGLRPYRSGGFINRDYDMARITIDLPIRDAKKLKAALCRSVGLKMLSAKKPNRPCS